jgi:hypothetical protein
MDDPLTTAYMSQEEDLGLTAAPGDIGEIPLDDSMGSLIGKLRSYCPTLFSKLSLWERDFLENSANLHHVTTSTLSTFTSELNTISLQVPTTTETPSAPTCATRQPSPLTEVLHPSSPSNTPPLSITSQDTIEPLEMNTSLEPFHTDSDNPNLLPSYWDLDVQQHTSASSHRITPPVL